MKALRVVGLWVALVLGMASSAMAEGFALTEWSARGLGLASGMVGRADDVSAIAYNAAGITQLPGVQVMGGMGLRACLETSAFIVTRRVITLDISQVETKNACSKCGATE